jgi:hypothetical protein
MDYQQLLYRSTISNPKIMYMIFMLDKMVLELVYLSNP